MFLVKYEGKTMSAQKKLLVGNWKMNGTLDAAKSLIASVINQLSVNEHYNDMFDFAVCPPLIHLHAIRHAVVGYPKIQFGAQDCSAHENGAHTGDISASMLRDASCRYVIVGHSERRVAGDSDNIVKSKAQQALANDLTPIICVGETAEQRDAGKALDVVREQLANSVPDTRDFDKLIIAYEPVWAIGTGNVPSSNDIHQMHDFIHKNMPHADAVLYGGSLKPENAGEILGIEHVDGGLIGGASLQADTFLGIAEAYLKGRA